LQVTDGDVPTFIRQQPFYLTGNMPVISARVATTPSPLLNPSSPCFPERSNSVILDFVALPSDLRAF
jgi:hypothetical protein